MVRPCWGEKSFDEEATITFSPESEAFSFFSARPIYGDARDGAPPVSPGTGFEANLVATLRSSQDCSTWGWKRNWQQ